MAKCDTGYICDVCGQDVPLIEGSDLYLRFVIGMVEGRALLSAPERHIRCNPALAQFIVDPGFKPVIVDGPADKRNLAAGVVAEQERLVTAGWQRLQTLAGSGLAISEYPLAEVRRA